jgi:pimeloyl-ACP methyl ester carboxylesterase
MTTWVLLRGLAREQRHWGAFPEVLRQRLPAGDTVIARDLPGAGTRCAERSPTSVAEMAQAVRGDLRLNGPSGPYVLVALSLGAMTAMQWAVTAPQELRGCVLINSSLATLSPFWRRLRPGAIPPLLRWLLSASAEAKERAVFDISSNQAFDAAVVAQWAAIAHSAPVSARNALRQLFAASRFDAPARLPVPALVLTSAGDRLVSHHCSRDREALATAVAGASRRGPRPAAGRSRLAGGRDRRVAGRSARGRAGWRSLHEPYDG